MGKHRRLRHRLGSRTFTLVLYLFCANSISTLAQSAQPESKLADSVRGIVLNSVTREPIGRALVYSNDNRFATMTDGEGRFEFTFPPEESTDNKEGTPLPTNIPGATINPPYRGPNRPQMLMARKPGFLGERSGPQTWHSAIAGKEMTIELTPEALIVGRVALPTSEPSDTIQLEIYVRRIQNGRARWGRAGAAATKSNGEFRFAELSPGTYKLLSRELMDRDPVIFSPGGQLYGYPPVYFPNATDFASAQTIQLAAGQIFQANISLVKHPYYPIKVAVANVPPGGAGMSIIVSPPGHRGPGFALGYNNEDQTIVGTLPDGNYTLEASTYGLNGSSGLFNLTVKGTATEGSRMILVPNGSISVDVKEEFTATEDSSPQREYVINGQTRIEQGPRRYLNVFLESADDFGGGGGASLRSPTGPEDDSLVIDNVQPGRYWLQTNSSRGFVGAISSGATDLQHQLLVVGLGASGAPIEVTMRDAAAEIDGTVEGAAAPLGASDGTAASRPQGDNSSAHLYCIPLPDSSGEFREIWVPQNGKFGPQEIPPGTYRLLAFDRPQPELEYRNPEAMRAFESKGLVVRLIAGQKEHLHVQLISSSE